MKLAELVQGRWSALGLTGGVWALIVYFRTRHLNEEAALNGLSPEQVAVAVNSPELFANDFPSGALELLKSGLYHIYPAAHAAGFDVISVWAAVIAVEVAVFAAATIWAVRRLFPNEPWALAAIAALLFTTSSLTTPDLARFQFPYYGWTYAFAWAGVLVCITETVRNRYVTASIFLVATFLIHPIGALFAGAFIAGAVLFNLFRGIWPPLFSVMLAGAIAMVGCGSWLFWIAGQGTVTGGAVEPETFIALVRAQNYHWFPSYLGVYWDLHERHLMPLLATLSLTAWAVSAQPPTSRPVVQQLCAGIVVILLICAAGLFVAEFIASPFLLKIAMHRSDTVAVLIGSLLILRALFRDLLAGDDIERGFAAFLILLPLVSDIGLAPLPVVLRVGYAAYKAQFGRSWQTGVMVAALLSVLLVCLMLFYSVAGIVSGRVFSAYSGIYLTWETAILILAAISAACWRRIDVAGSGVIRIAAALGVIAILAALRSPSFEILSSDTAQQRGRDALAAQQWARENTPPGSLFMIDPGLGYMWRDKSHRPSFGTPREWLFISIMYNTRNALLQDGLQRYRALGLENPDYVYDPSFKRMFPLIDRIIGDAVDSFYGFAEQDFRRLTEEYGVDYFVFRPERLEGSAPLREVFRNDNFVIAASR